jgi:hypothetical protein
MQGEVLRHLTDMTDRAALARTCLWMHQRISPTLPKLPRHWQHAWDTLKRHGTPGEIQAGRAAFLELIVDVGLPTWPGAFHYGCAEFSDNIWMCDRDLFWQWRNDQAGTFFNLSFLLDPGTWRLTSIRLRPRRRETCTVFRLALLDPDRLAAWRNFVQSERIKPDHHPTDKPSYF